MGAVGRIRQSGGVSALGVDAMTSILRPARSAMTASTPSCDGGTIAGCPGMPTMTTTDWPTCSPNARVQQEVLRGLVVALLRGPAERLRVGGRADVVSKPALDGLDEVRLDMLPEPLEVVACELRGDGLAGPAGVPGDLAPAHPLGQVQALDLVALGGRHLGAAAGLPAGGVDDLRRC